MKLLSMLGIPFAIGVAAGVLAALCGVGGGVIMVPAFVMLLGLDQKTAVATSMAVIVPTAIAATAQHVKNGLIDWKVALATAVAATLTSYLVADTIKHYRNETLTRIFAVVIILFGFMMLFSPQQKAKAVPTDVEAPSDAAARSGENLEGR